MKETEKARRRAYMRAYRQRPEVLALQNDKHRKHRRVAQNLRGPCPTCKRPMILTGKPCYRCRDRDEVRSHAAPGQRGGVFTGPPSDAVYAANGLAYFPSAGVELADSVKTAKEMTDLRAARVEAYAAQTGVDGKGSIDYQDGIRRAVAT